MWLAGRLMEVPAQYRWRCIELVQLSFSTLSSSCWRQVAVGFKWLLAQVALYCKINTNEFFYLLRLRHMNNSASINISTRQQLLSYFVGSGVLL